MGSRRRVLLISADGMRPDLFNRQLMPTCARLMREGVHVADYHASYPTHSRVNITTISTGTLPGKHGIVANIFRVDGATSDGVIDTGHFPHIQQLDSITAGNAILMPTLPEMLAQAGMKSQIVATSSDAAGLIWNRSCPDRVFDLNQSVERPEITAVRAKLGPVPSESHPNRIPHLYYAARALSEHYFDDPELRFIAVWLSEPDHSLHHFGVGSPEVKLALKAVDDAVAEILAGLDRRGIRDEFDIFLVSDHGHSTTRAHRSLGEYVDRAFREHLPSFPALVSASDFLYLAPGERELSLDEFATLVRWLQDQPWCGAVLSGTEQLNEIPGVLPLIDVWGGSMNRRGPLLAVTPVWTHSVNQFGLPGMIAGLTEQVALRSTHGSASPYELHAFCVANGASFKTGEHSLKPAGAQDLAPTITRLLGLPRSDHFDGRELDELFKDGSAINSRSEVRVVAPVNIRSSEYRPALIMRHVGRSQYLHSAVNARRLSADEFSEMPAKVQA
jgi:arylsulfatase A-like enzyme